MTQEEYKRYQRSKEMFDAVEQAYYVATKELRLLLQFLGNSNPGVLSAVEARLTEIHSSYEHMRRLSSEVVQAGK